MNAIITEGGLLPADILDAIAAGAVDGQRPEDFGMERTRTLSDRISTAWQAARAQWALFQAHLADLPPHDSTAAALTRDYWAIPLLRILGYTLERNRQAPVVAGRTYAISHRAGDADDAPPIHITGVRVSLDVRPPSPPRTPPRAGGTGGVRMSPHALVQEYLNATDHLWGIVTNGVRLRLLRESARFTRPTYVEFDLQAMLEGERFSDFALLYRLLHRSRLPQRAADAPECWLERYHQQALAQGGRVRDRLRDGVEQALKTLANGLLRHPANERLRRALASGDLTPQAFYRQVLRLVYRLLFLMVAEERNLIAATGDDADRALAIYHAHYSMARLRRLAEHAGVAASAGEGGYGDLWIGLLAAFRIFEGSVSRRFPIAPLDGDLFSETACPHLTAETRMANADLLAAIRALALYHDPESRTLRRVNYGALDVEELGSVYEALLDYRPVIAHAPAGSPDVRFDLIPGTERKTTGSYYTRPELVQELIASALEPVLAQRLASAGRDAAAREAALLAIRVCDPACGSGHFLLAAARRLGRELARIRAGDDEPAPAQFRHAVRDVIRRCIFGVDLNPLAVDLCKLALWIEGHAAGLPLSFLDHHIRCGNSLVGATRALVEQGIPDEAYRPIHGDEKGIAAALRKRNRAERDAYTRDRAVQERMFADEPTDAPLARALAALDDLPDESVAAVRARALDAAPPDLHAALAMRRARALADRSPDGPAADAAWQATQAARAASPRCTARLTHVIALQTAVAAAARGRPVAAWRPLLERAMDAAIRDGGRDPSGVLLAPVGVIHARLDAARAAVAAGADSGAPAALAQIAQDTARVAAALDAPRRWRLNVQIALADAWRLLHAPDDALAAAADAAALLPTVGSPKLTRRLIAIVRALPPSPDRRAVLDLLTPRREEDHA